MANGQKNGFKKGSPNGNNSKGGASQRSNNYKGKERRDYRNDDKARQSYKGADRRRNDDAAAPDPRSNNDASWYKVAEQIAKDAGQLSFNNPLGMAIPGITDAVNDNFRFPGVCALWYGPTIGNASEATDPINLQGRKLISYLRSTVSNKIDFSAADAMMYLIAMDSMYSLYSWCVRLYGLHFAYMGLNRYYPQAIFDALNLAVDAKSDWSSFRAWINTFAYQLSQVFVPADMDYFKRHMWMCANAYLDAPDVKAQTYIFTPEYLYKWDDTTTPLLGTCLVPVYMPNSRRANSSEVPVCTLNDIMTFGDSLLENLVRNKDVGEFSGLFYRAFPKGCIQLSTISEDFAIAPVYNPEVSMQIHNATLCGDMVIDNQLEADASAIIIQTEYDALQVAYRTFTLDPTVFSFRHIGKHRLLDIDTPSPTVDDVFVASRLCVAGTPDTDNAGCWLSEFGTEVLLHADIITLGDGYQPPSIIVSASMNKAAGSVGWMLGRASAFRSFPYLYLVTYFPDQTQSLLAVLGDVTNYTTLTEEDLRKLHSAATMALFNIPTVGTGFGQR